MHQCVYKAVVVTAAYSFCSCTRPSQLILAAIASTAGRQLGGRSRAQPITEMTWSKPWRESMKSTEFDVIIVLPCCWAYWNGLFILPPCYIAILNYPSNLHARKVETRNIRSPRCQKIRFWTSQTLLPAQIPNPSPPDSRSNK